MKSIPSGAVGLGNPPSADAAASHNPEHRRGNAPRRAAIAAMVGGTLEYYDNYIYALAAALVFGKVFFPADAGGVATMAALSTFAVSYVARPLGAILLGHLGDRVSRKMVLVVILVLMGTCTFLVGCLPGYAEIGFWAPVLLVTLRILQGISVGGETAAATVLTIELAPAGRRGFFASWAPGGIVGGFLLASVVFIPIAAMPESDLVSWGWRLPFLASVLVTAAGLIIRARLSEPEAFEEAKQDDQLVARPLVETLRSHRKALALVVVCSLAFTVDTVIKVFSLNFATTVHGISRDAMLVVLIISHVGALATQPMLGAFSDRVGRRPVFIAGNLGCALLIFPYFMAIEARNLPLLAVIGFLSVSCAYAAINATYASFFAEMFHLKVRQTGMALGLQVGLIAAGFAPTIYVALTAADPANWMPVAVVTAVIASIAALGGFYARETAHTPLKELGEELRPQSHLLKAVS